MLTLPLAAVLLCFCAVLSNTACVPPVVFRLTLLAAPGVPVGDRKMPAACSGQRLAARNCSHRTYNAWAERASLQLRSQESSGATFGNNIPRYYSLLRHGWSWGAKVGCTMYTIPCPFDDQGHYSKYAHAPAVDESTSCVKARTITSNFWVCGSTFSLCCSMQQAQGECHHIITESWRKQPKVG